ncbi:MAG TPA: phosphotransferase [Vicinamibacterales bacterium]|nr:phosphotransferase [Vicinamibacterales bacterium]
MTPATPSSAVLAYLERTNQSGARAVPLTGDASDRQYFRVLPGDGSSFVLAVHAEPFAFDRLPFVNVAGLFERMPAPVPRILGHADDLGVLALEDLGDVTLQAHVGAASADEHTALYEEAVDLIELVQRRGRELADDRYLPFGVVFDEARLTWEFDFFLTHFLEAYRGVAWAPGEREAVRAELVALAEDLAAEPRVLCHRDYHSRNLMLHEGRLSVIDFQDARLGPDTYDLASLVRDSYVEIGEPMVRALIDRYLSLTGRLGSRDSFRVRFDAVALQRNLKALGTFGYQTTARQNPVYIQYMPRTLHHVRGTLHAYARFGRLADLLATHLPEVR